MLPTSRGLMALYRDSLRARWSRWSKIFRTNPNWSPGPPVSLTMGNGRKATGAWRWSSTLFYLRGVSMGAAVTLSPLSTSLAYNGVNAYHPFNYLQRVSGVWTRGTGYSNSHTKTSLHLETSSCAAEYPTDNSGESAGGVGTLHGATPHVAKKCPAWLQHAIWKSPGRL
jgi:hypothetical protein